MSQSTPIDLSQLPAPTVVEPLDFESIFSAMLADLRARDPEFDALVESDPAYKILEAAAYRELLLRQRVNDAARAVMLAHATGANLDNLGALFSVARLPGEPDASLRRRIQLAPEGYSVAGPSAAYLYHTLSAAAAWTTSAIAWTQRVKDAAVYSTTPGTVTVAVLAHPEETVTPGDSEATWGPTDGRAWGLRIRHAGGYLPHEDPQVLAVEQLPAALEVGWVLWLRGGATFEVTSPAAIGATSVEGILSGTVADRAPGGLIYAVQEALSAETVRPICDTVVVRSASVDTFTVAAALVLRHGPDPDLVVAEGRERLIAYLTERHAPGRAITRSAIIGALHVAGVHKVTLSQPAADIAREPWQAAWCPPENITLTLAGLAD